MDALPQSVMRAAQEVARFCKVPVASPAIVGLAVIAVALGKKIQIEERPGLIHHPSLFFVLVAESGERKSPAFIYMSAPLEEWAESQEEQRRLDIERVKAENQVINRLVKTLNISAGNPDMNELERESTIQRIADEECKRQSIPPEPRMFTSDTTEQRLFQKLHEHGGAYAVMSGDGRQVVDALMGRGADKGFTGDAIYLAATTGDTITRDRVGGDNGPESLIIRKPCLNVAIMVQPDKYLEMARHPSLRASGALARVIPIRLPSLVGTRFGTAK
ncbi:MAG: DUF3987 domain-containing protein [Magnetococcales bacterium]|nr:DUF3987 domain-containing protein [Magnetococcales bacterium]